MTRGRLLLYMLLAAQVASGLDQWWDNLLESRPAWPYLVTPLLLPAFVVVVIALLMRQDHREEKLR